MRINLFTQRFLNRAFLRYELAILAYDAYSNTGICLFPDRWISYSGIMTHSDQGALLDTMLSSGR